ncbi:fatty acid synthase [Lasius niger]|uniref:Fatty acid synthase n=1 Tax=Lasius niger TaxID=67767 RepID=A0A0J7KPB3_LASNI|nr:fatty acid synthase [Lasius niger]
MMDEVEAEKVWRTCANEVMWARPIDNNSKVRKENARWNLATHHLRRAIGMETPREILWMKTVVACSVRGGMYVAAADKKLKDAISELYTPEYADMLRTKLRASIKNLLESINKFLRIIKEGSSGSLTFKNLDRNVRMLSMETPGVRGLSETQGHERPLFGHGTIGHVANGHKIMHTVQLDTVQLDTDQLDTVYLDT